MGWLLRRSFEPSDDYVVCECCLLLVVQLLQRHGCEIERSAYRFDASHVVPGRRRLNLDEHFLNMDDLDSLIRFRREDFPHLSELLLPDNEWIRCKQGTKAHRNEAMLLLLLDMSHQNTLQLLSYFSSAASRRSPQEISMILNAVRILLFTRWRKFVYLWPGNELHRILQITNG